VKNPVARGELRLRGIDPSTTSKDIHGELVSLSGCHQYEMKVSPIRNMRDGMGVAWATCPLQAAVKLAEIGVVALGWTKVKIELLKKCPVQCFKCWHFGHVRSNSRVEIDRKGICFRCGSVEHTIGTCNAVMPKCLICEETGKDSRHRMGVSRCLMNQGFPTDTTS